MDDHFKAKLEKAVASDWPSSRIASYYGISRRTISRMRAARIRSGQGGRKPGSTNERPNS